MQVQRIMKRVKYPYEINPQRRRVRREDAIFAQGAQTTEANNRYLTVFALENFRRNFSKNCFPVAQLSATGRFIKED